MDVIFKVRITMLENDRTIEDCFEINFPVLKKCTSWCGNLKGFLMKQELIDPRDSDVLYACVVRLKQHGNFYAKSII